MVSGLTLNAISLGLVLAVRHHLYAGVQREAIRDRGACLSHSAFNGGQPPWQLASALHSAPALYEPRWQILGAFPAGNWLPQEHLRRTWTPRSLQPAIF
ncbi:hypothetical protein BJX63DRAFT_320111 [Aspergillus granulosus]|uniref:Uncharacterized protein n=1 Tax=Aspergillus granulosus TaxID=176169 RepID=A0ABR4H6K1_9EURO